MDGADVLELLARGAVLLVLAALVQALARRRSAGLRTVLSSATLAGLVALPLVSLALPGVRVDAPAGLDLPRALRADVAAEPERATTSAPIDRRSGDHDGPSASAGGLDASAALSALWLTGSLALLALHGVRRLVLARSIHTGVRLDGPRWRGLLARAAGAMQVRDAVRLVAGERVRVPFALGATIALPAAAVEWDDERLDAVLRHELGHVRRHDGRLHGLAVLARALHWPDPLAWRAFAGFVRMRERACDDLVLASGLRASVYASALVRSAAELPRQSRLAGGAPALGGEPDVAGRVRAVLDPSRPRARPARAALGLVALATALVVCPLGTLHAARRVEDHGPSALAAVRAMLALADRSAADVPSARLIDALADERHVEPAVAGLRRDGPRLGGLPETSAGKEAARLLVRRGTASVDALVGALADERAAVRLHAAWALGCIGERRSAPALAARLADDPEARVRRIAAWALGEMAAGAQRSALEAALADPADLVRAQAAHSLGDLRDARALPALLAALGDDVAAVRERAAHGLGDIGSSRAVAALAAARDDDDPGVRAMVRWALRECGAEADR